MQEIYQYLSKDTDFQSIVTGLEKGLKEQLIAGLSQSARHLAYAALYKETHRPQLIVTHNMFQAQKIYEDLCEFLSEEQVLLYPVNELVITEVAIASPEIMSQRIEALNRLSADFDGILIVPYAGLRRLLVPRNVWRSSQLHVKTGGNIDTDHMIRTLISLGYERVEMIENKGEFSVRGGIIDIFPLPMEFPIRIELFDEEIDSIRLFEISSQRSKEKLQEVTISPTNEVFGSLELFVQGAQRLEQKVGEALPNIRDKAVREKVMEKIGWDREQILQGHVFPGIYKYLSLLYPQYESLRDYMRQDTIVIIDEPSRVADSSKQLEKDEAEWKTALIQEGEYVSTIKLAFDYDEVVHAGPSGILYFSLFLRQVPGTQPQNIVNFNSRLMQNFHGQMNVLKAEMQRWEKAGVHVIFLAANEERASRLERVLEDYGMAAEFVKTLSHTRYSRPVIVSGNLQNGFELPIHRLAVITEGEVFSRRQRKVRKSRQEMADAERIKSYLELKPGDYVVHIDHGIGRYLGIKTGNYNGMFKDYLQIKYAGNDDLFVPIDQIDRVQKYIGSQEKEPKIYRLGSGEWKKVKSKVKSSVQDIAADLIKLYAEREATVGYAFGQETEEQREFEALFPYDETPDQLKSIQEIKADMESPRPMDRLLCGDVGYGKTEVAIRAAFKAAIEGKQVAVLVPTTILAHQHYETFRERFADYPVNIEVLSRFRSRKEISRTVKGLKDGTVDIIIGTHRLLSKDVQFRDLGILIVDEEQRFGVSHKEKLKKLKTNVDVLTLTATPIPRTLHMSMLGVRDLSVIETPPENRFPVQTYVLEYSAALVREAIERELARDGQVYFLYNQVQGIEKMAAQISALVPEARVAVAHGQMSEGELEHTMLDFLDGSYDVLVSTTIIEAGVDIPNVNTLIVYNSDRLGLSQLYQLRGRVGRSNRIAYAYFTYQRDKVLQETAEKRLQAMKEFTELGSGFKIAMRDLAIRGAGNLLGAEQHGFIASVGFDLYSQMLKEAIEELQGKQQQKEVTHFPEIDINIDAYIPSEYISDGQQKIEIYKKFSAISSGEDVEDLTDELIDRFGEIPRPVLNLFTVSRLRLLGKKHKITDIKQKGEEITLLLDQSLNEEIDGGLLFAWAARSDQKIAISSGQQIGITFKLKGLSPEHRVEVIHQFLAQFDQMKKTKGELKHAVT